MKLMLKNAHSGKGKQSGGDPLQNAKPATTRKAAKADAKQLKRWLRLHELPLFLWLVALWTMLWQEISLLSVCSGALVALIVTRVFFLPPVKLSGRFNPVAAGRYLVFFLYELMLGSLQVAWLALNPRKKARSAVLAVQLRTHSDFILTMTALTISLIPGSLIVDVDRFNSVIYLHVLHAPTAKEQQKLRADVLLIERMLVAAIGTVQEVESCRDS